MNESMKNIYEMITKYWYILAVLALLLFTPGKKRTYRKVRRYATKKRRTYKARKKSPTRKFKSKTRGTARRRRY